MALGDWAASVFDERPVGVTESRSGAWILLLRDRVVKVHRHHTQHLTQRLRAAAAAPQLFVTPLLVEPVPWPWGPATVWPRVSVWGPEDDALPWSESGTLLAQLHRTAPPDLPAATPTRRLAEAADRLASRRPRHRLVELARGILGHPRPARATWVHGDWHLGQVGSDRGGLRLLDVDDIAIGDPVWDLARPAGWWAAGLLAESDWSTFLGAYRDANGPAVPTAGDPWPVLDLPARAAVVAAACRGLADRESGQPSSVSDDALGELLRCCRRMAPSRP